MGNPKVTLVTEPANHFQALYLDGRLIGDFGDNLTERTDKSYEPPVDILENFELEARRQKSAKHWTDYGWEYDAEWPDQLSAAPELMPEELEPYVPTDGSD